MITRIVLVLAGAAMSPAWGSSTGITGYSGSPSSFGTCSGCHTGSTYNYNGVISVDGSSSNTSVEENSAYGVTFALTRSSGTSATHVGFNMDTTGGTLSESSSASQALSGQLTHSSPAATNGSGNYTFSSLTWTAPAAASSGNTYTLYACGNLTNYNGVETDDGPPACDSINVTVYEVPTLGSWTTGASYTEGTPVTLETYVYINDTDSSSMNRAEFSITNNQAGDQLLCPNSLPSGISCTGGGSSSLTLYGTSSEANYETAIEGVKFDNTSDDPSTNNRSIRLRVRDADYHYSSYSYKTLSVTAVNDSPVVSGVASSLGYTEGDGAVNLDSFISVSDPDSGNLNLATIEIYSGYDAGEDALSWSSSLCTTYSLSCSFSSGTFTVSGTGTLAEYENVLESVTYSNNAQDPNTATRYLRYRLRDTGSEYSGYDYLTLTVSAVNDAPTSSGIGGTLGYTENDPATVVDSALTLADVDNTQLNLAQVTISANYSSGEDSLSANASLCSSYGLSCSFSSGTLTIIGTALVSEYEAVLESVAYENSSDAPATSTRTIGYRVRDTGSVYSSYDYAYVSVTAENDAPQITSTPSASATEGVQYSYTVTVKDPDDSGFGAELTLALNTAEDNNGTALSGVSFNTSTGQLTWTPPNGLAGPAHFEVQVADGGGNGSTADVQGWTVSVDAVNDPPTITSTAPPDATEDQLYQYQVQVSDPDDNNDGSGDLTFSLSNAPGGMSVNNTGLVTWTPGNGVSSSGAVTLTVADGEPLSDSETFTVSVTAVNDAPEIQNTPSGAALEATEESVWSWDVDATDIEGDAVTYCLASGPTGMTINSTTGLLEWTADDPVTSPVSVSVIASDGGPGCPDGADGAVPDTQSFELVVTAVDDLPTIDTTPSDTSADEEQPWSYDVNASDVDSGALYYCLDTAPAGMTINNSTGLITWTPDDPITSTVGVEVVVSDTSNTCASRVVGQTFSISVAATNDSPAISPASVSARTVEELSAFSLQLTEDDPDDTNGGLLWSLSGAPAGFSIDGTGLISGTPGEDTAGTYSPTVTLADGGEDFSVEATLTFSLEVTLKDADGDGVADYDDNCVNAANASQANNDGDAQGDICDADDDNDGIDDTAELANGLDPFDDSDAGGDLDGDGLTNLEEFQTCAASSDSTCNAIGTDSVAPVISVSDVTVPSTGYFTVVALKATAEDGIDGVVDVTPDDQGPFRPGRHSITWTARDSEGNSATAVQTLDVLPRVSLGGSSTAGEGAGVSVPVRLNGPAPTYPVSVQLSLSGTADAADHDLAAPVTVTFNSGTEATVAFNTLADGLAEGDERLRLTLDGISGDAVPGEANSHDLLIVERQVAPETAMTVTQNSIQSLEVYQGQGMATVSANATDANGDAPLVYDWASTLTLNLAGDSVSFDPDAVSPGTHTVSLSVSDAVATVRDQVAIRVRTAAEFPASGTTTDSDGDGLDDGTEGPGDSDGDGIPDYRDGIDSPAFQVVEQKDAADPGSALLMKVEDGLSLRIGARAMSAGNDRASLSSSQVGVAGSRVADPLYTHLGLIYDFEVHGLTEAKRTARVVVPLRYALVPGAVWRKFANGSWYSFISNGSERLHSSPRVDGDCPDPLAAGWHSGLTPGHACVRLTLVDGGANDADGVVNGVIRDPGGAAVRTELPQSESAPDSAANSGELGVRVLLVLAVLGLFRRRMKSY